MHHLVYIKRGLVFLGNAFLASACLVCAAFGQTTPAGTWQSVDDATGNPRAVIKISQAGDFYSGVVVRSLTPVAPGVVPVCDLCSDDRKGKPLMGMEIIRKVGVAEQGGVWSGGEILDPDKGKTYGLQLRLQDDGKKLQVRGKIGPFFRNQVWTRLPAVSP